MLKSPSTWRPPRRAPPPGGAARTKLARPHPPVGLWPERLAADTAYATGEMLAWLVHERGIEPHVPVLDKSGRTDGTFSAPTSPTIMPTTPTTARPGRR